MRNSSEEAILPTRAGRRAKRWGLAALLATLVLLLAACQTVPPEPAPQVDPEFDLELELAHLDLPVNEQFRVRFLPPLAKKSPTGDFVSDMALEIRFFNVNPNTSQASGMSLGTTLSTAKRTIASKRGTFSTIWLSLSLLLERKATQYLRAEIRLPGGPNAPVCNQASEHCLGYLDIYVFKGLWLGRQTVPEGFVPIPALVGVLPMSFKVLEENTDPPANNPVPNTIDQLTGVTTGAFLDVTSGNCASSFLTRPGQGLQRVGAGLQRVGAVGGLFQGRTSDFPSTLLAPAAIGADLAEMLDDVLPPSWSAVLLVVDDFDPDYELPDGLFAPDPDLAQLAPFISHGALVLHHLRQMVPQVLAASIVDSGEGIGPNGEPRYWYQVSDDFGYGPAYLYVQAINVGNNSTDVIPDQIKYAIEAYDDAGVYEFVVNMSFAVVPCSVLADYENARGLDSFEDYVAALANVNDIGTDSDSLGALDKLVSTPIDVDAAPLLAYLACPFPSLLNGVEVCDGSGPVTGDWGPFSSLTHVAASGNYGNQYALYPAASPYVVSVGSLEASGVGFAAADYSNVAEIAAPGGIFELYGAAGQSVGYAGTSFAAPVVSLFLAADSMYPYYECLPPDFEKGETSQLAHGDYDMEPFYVPGSGTDPAQLTPLCQVIR